MQCKEKKNHKHGDDLIAQKNHIFLIQVKQSISKQNNNNNVECYISSEKEDRDAFVVLE